MKDLRWICAGALVAVAGTIAFANVAGTSRPTAAVPAAPESAPLTATAPTTPVVAKAVAPAPVSAPTPQVAVAKATPAPGIVPGSAGMVISIDPDTGEPGMPTREQLQELELETNAALSHEDDGLVQVKNTDGHWSVDLQGRYQEFAVVRKTADGKTVMGCVDHPSKIDRIQPAPAALEEE